MSIMNSFVVDIFERIAGEAKELARIGKSSTLRIRDIETGVKLVPEFKIEGAPWGSEKSLERKVARLSTIALRQAPRLDRKKIIDI